ncbi:diguanylate cyclase [Salinisphaera sp. LB1]|uniref:GGDEF domain-containing protein n=1 Tax=Salinisphaera sp. LB1 TaxID=2183911 RepID=UPI000D70591D|nr:diguanylate cyclase [Salinisphaera sp. LB1]AWN16762.1 Two-component response regulator [Salinisphaera sp. LB1]
MIGDSIRRGYAALVRWLGQFSLRFEPALEAEFERATVRARRYRFRRIGYLQLAMTHLGAVGLYVLLDNAAVVILATLAVDLFSLGCFVILRRKPDVFVRESVMMAGVLCWVLMAETVSLYAEPRYLWIIQTAIALQPFLMAAGIQLRFPYCVVGCIATVATVVVGNALFTHAAPSEQLWMALVQTVAAIYALFGCWRLEERERANYRAIRESERNARDLDRANAHLARLTHHDEMTGVLNRRGLRRALAKAPGARVAVLVDVDYFKRYNDHYGHLAGDRCLCQVADCLSDALAPGGDLLARWGGEEFLVIVDTDRSEVGAERGERVRAAVRALGIAHEASPVGAVVSISAGYAVGPRDASANLDEWVHRADQALYSAKQAGRNCVRGWPQGRRAAGPERRDRFGSEPL